MWVEGETVVCLSALCSAMRRYAINHVMKHWCALGAQSTAAPNPVPEEGTESKKQAKQGEVLQFFTFFNVENSRDVDNFWVVETNVLQFVD